LLCGRPFSLMLMKLRRGEIDEHTSATSVLPMSRDDRASCSKKSHSSDVLLCEADAVDANHSFTLLT
jgi:hypothetical protein